MDQKKILERRAKWTGGLFAVAAVAVFVIVNLPWQYATIDSDYPNSLGDSGRLEWAPRTEPVTRAGWPWRYQVTSHERAADEVSFVTRHWSVVALVGNCLVAAIGCALVWWLTIYRCHRLLASANPVRTRKWFDVGIALACLLIPALVAGQLYWVSRQHRELASLVDEHGSARLSVQVPAWLGDRVPDAFKPFLARVRVVVLERPDQETLERVFACRTLQHLSIRNSDLTTVDLQEMRQSYELSGVALERCQIERDDVAAVASLTSLTRLSFRSSVLPDGDLRPLAKLPWLNVLDLRNTEISLSKLGRPRWADSIRRLYLSVPDKSSGDASLTLKGWESLKQLVIVAPRGRPAKSREPTLDINVSDLPSLERLLLTPGPTYRLVGQNLPSLGAIETRRWSEEAQFPMWDSALRLCQFEVFDLDSAAQLTELTLSANRLTRFRLRHVDRLQQVLCCVVDRSRTETTIPYLPQRGQVQNIIGELRDQPSIQFLNLSGLPLKDTDLSPLAELPYLKSLNLNFTGVQIDQLSWVPEAPSLQAVTASQCPGERTVVEAWLANLPKLKRLSLDLKDLPKLTIENNLAIEALTTDEFENLKELSLVNLPRLESAMVISGPLQRVRIEHLLRLTELRFHSPLPADIVLEGLPSLTVFSAGGPECTDEIVDSLKTAPRLRELTLAYPNVSTAQLKKIGMHGELQELRLRGCNINKEILQYWHQLNLLRSVDLGDNPIDEATLQWMRSLPTLRQLELAHNELSQAVWMELMSMRQLAELTFNDMDIPIEAMQMLASAKSVQRLELVDLRLSEAHWKALEGASSLDRLVIRNCGLDESQLVRLLRSNASVAIDTGGSPNLRSAKSADLTVTQFRRLRPDLPTNLYDYVPRMYDRFETVVRENPDGSTVPVQTGSQPRNMPMDRFRQAGQGKIKPTS